MNRGDGSQGGWDRGRRCRAYRGGTPSVGVESAGVVPGATTNDTTGTAGCSGINLGRCGPGSWTPWNVPDPVGSVREFRGGRVGGVPVVEPMPSEPGALDGNHVTGANRT